MPLRLTAAEIALRLALTVLAALLVGYNRGEHGKAAGIVTTLLVTLAASVAMIQVNLLLPLAGREPNSFVMNDLMRLPLGILTGVGFIGAGAILRRNELVVGVTTAATLWVMTVVGLCLGGGEVVLGMVATALVLFALWVVKGFEGRLRREFRARFSIDVSDGGPTEAEIRHRLQANGLAILGIHCSIQPTAACRGYSYEVRWLRSSDETDPPQFLTELANQTGVLRIAWRGPP
ncbi:MAG TPA: MgtC/SapB family protein [Steroidobacteraceae bacterium]|nr:MgtC/SapB family protein [Steroidobacteraceae bacterium]